MDASLIQLISCIPSPAMLVDKHGGILAANAEVEAVFGYEAGELNGQSVDILIPQSARDKYRRYQEESASNPNQMPMGKGRVLAARHKDGSDVKVEVILKLLDTDQMHVIASIKDVSEREEVKSNLALSQSINKTGTWYFDVVNDEVWWSA